eukprot:CFRG0752T1
MRKALLHPDDVASNSDAEDAVTSKDTDGESEVTSGEAGEGRRRRRTFAELDRSYVCEHPNCGRPYASEHSLNQHVRLKHASRSPARRRGLTLPMYIPIPNQGSSMPGSDQQHHQLVVGSDGMVHSPAIGRVRGIPYANPKFPLKRHGSLKDCHLSVNTHDMYAPPGPMSLPVGETVKSEERSFGYSSQPVSPATPMNDMQKQQLQALNQVTWAPVTQNDAHQQFVNSHDALSRSNTSSPVMERLERMRLNGSSMSSLSVGNLPVTRVRSVPRSSDSFHQLIGNDSAMADDGWQHPDQQFSQRLQQSQSLLGNSSFRHPFSTNMPNVNQTPQQSSQSINGPNQIDLMSANFVSVPHDNEEQIERQRHQQVRLQNQTQFNQKPAFSMSQDSISSNSSSLNQQKFYPRANNPTMGGFQQQNELQFPQQHGQSQSFVQQQQGVSMYQQRPHDNLWNPQGSGPGCDMYDSTEDLGLHSNFEPNNLFSSGENSMVNSNNNSSSNIMAGFISNQSNGNIPTDNSMPSKTGLGVYPSPSTSEYMSPMSTSTSNVEGVLPHSSSFSDINQITQQTQMNQPQPHLMNGGQSPLPRPLNTSANVGQHLHNHHHGDSTGEADSVHFLNQLPSDVSFLEDEVQIIDVNLNQPRISKDILEQLKTLV